MTSPRKIIDLYNRAVDEGHPDPERAILGRAALTDFNAEFNKDGKQGIFGLSSSKASGLGWENLDSIEESFQAALELDARSFVKHSDVNRMFMDSAGTSKDNYLKSLDKAYAGIQDKLMFEDGKLVDIKLQEDIIEEVESSVIDETKAIEDIQEDVKREVANISASERMTQVNSGVNPEAELTRLTGLLKEYIKAAV